MIKEPLLQHALQQSAFTVCQIAERPEKFANYGLASELTSEFTRAALVCYWICKTEESYMLPMPRSNTEHWDFALAQGLNSPRIDNPQGLCLLQRTIHRDS